jgi:hypothetical protein
MLMTSWLCKKQSGPMKDFEIFEDRIQDERPRKAQTHTAFPCGVGQEWDSTLSTPVY